MPARTAPGQRDPFSVLGAPPRRVEEIQLRGVAETVLMNDLFFKAANVIHRTVLSLSGGRLGGDVLNMPVLELTTTGARSGQKRNVMLTTPVQEGDTIVIVASRGGDPEHPSWFHNLKKNPEVEVAMRGGPKRPMRARVADADERARLWPLVTKRYRGYEQYQQRTTREIPLVLLKPVTD